MDPKYKIGQKVVIRPAKGQALSSREGNLESYVGQVGQVIDYYWISLRAAEAVFLYTVRVGADKKKIVLHEDELATHIE